MSLQKFIEDQKPLFDKGGKLETLYPLYEAIDTFIYTPADVTEGSTHVRDGMDLKRMMINVAIALTPAVFMAMYNTGNQAFMAMNSLGATAQEGWRWAIYAGLGLSADPSNIIGCMLYGSLFFLPVYIVCMTAGGIAEAIFSSVRGHEINEGFVVTGLLFPLTLPASIPLWQVAVGIIFGVVVAKEMFGGTGKNFLNVALTARAFLYFAYPAEISGDQVWVAADGYSGATALAQAATGGLSNISFSMKDAFFGFVPGSMGETSVLASLLGAIYLIITGVASWRTMFSLLIGVFGTAYLFNFIGSSTNPMFEVTPVWHLLIGGLAFGLVFMATDPVSSAMTEKGQWYYGGLIGIMVILVRVVNPAYPEGIMLAILFGNVFAPLIDYFVVKANIQRREARS